MTRTKASAVLAVSVIVVAALWSAPGAVAAGNGKPKPTTTSSTTTAPRTATSLTVYPAVHGVSMLGGDYFGYIVYPVVFSARLTTADGSPVAGRVVDLWETNSDICGGVTNAAGVAVCSTVSYGPLGDVYGRFYGDAEYGPSEGSFHPLP
jgi:hypothetical protein